MKVNCSALRAPAAAASIRNPGCRPTFQDLGADYYNQFNKERKINAYLKKLKSLGWEMPEAMEAQPA